MNKIVSNVRIDPAQLPELATSVALPSGRKRQEVGGAFCLIGIAAMGLYLSY
jgi:hypothetical protein